ncbi:hypothetical protein BDZ94DRAFT_453133 [Collybia nuda]|uniref:Fungal-type protein kinase domain-containing protein n=1 Tax=Collybia nuda TaxID=64659 RepID=A0A9P5XV87_9AGAR|nr:hypothetical protein BDZ94DRAFT_453133 [Collybia nuda]
MNNVMLYTPNPKTTTEGHKMCCRIIIDFDYASKINTSRHESVQGTYRGQTGMAPHMALAILTSNGKDMIHTLQHDLESLVYVLLNLFTICTGPGNVWCNFQDGLSVPMLEWFNEEASYQRIACIKQG